MCIILASLRLFI